MTKFETQLIKKHPTLPARVTRILTPHGEVMTPAFMPVGTRAFVNHMTPEDLKSAGSQIILGGNTYHMLCAPGLEMIQAMGGMHRMMDWQGPMLTDSGGFQVFSLSKNGKLCRIDEEGAHFRHPLTHQVTHLTPETSIQAQKVIGADIIMVFDECTPEDGGRIAAENAFTRTHRWLHESIESHLRKTTSAYGFEQALFGIIQGGSFRDLREKSTAEIVASPVDGIAIGGEVIGFDMQKTAEIIDWVRPLLPENKSRYTMGVGLRPQDLIDVVAKGIDIFDCVAPTRNARHGALYCGKIVEENNWCRFEGETETGHILIKKAIYARDENPIMEDCKCYTCKHFSRAYMHFLFKQKAALFSHLACIHNVAVMHAVCEKMRQMISLSL
ncbi:MAG: tRNA guanosine(34) transglycosylase Tgt [Gammaproteobacteria bacterium]|nr:tRNA guanosine(34) transglycosylase Tgt [Gammaproteobacteria bacterium]